MLAPLYPVITGFLVSLVALPYIIRYANKRKLFVELNQRKIHKTITPSMGGIAIFVGLAASALLNVSSANFRHVSIILLVLSIPLVIGILDDSVHLTPSRKIIGQIVAATFVFLVLDIKITSLYGLVGANIHLPEWLSYCATVVAIVLLTNAFNLIDGIDGLAGTFSIIALSFFAVWFLWIGQETFAIMSFGAIGSIAAFLLKNWQPSKIFMGDTGSLVIGMFLSMLAIAFLNENERLSVVNVLKFDSGIGTVLCVLIVPIIDTIRVVIIRVSRGISPLTADKRHIHHALVRIGKSHRFAVTLILIVHIFFVANALLLKEFGDLYVIGSVTVFSCVLCLILDKVIARHTLSRKSHNSILVFKQRGSVLKL